MGFCTAPWEREPAGSAFWDHDQQNSDGQEYPDDKQENLEKPDRPADALPVTEGIEAKFRRRSVSHRDTDTLCYRRLSIAPSHCIDGDLGVLTVIRQPHWASDCSVGKQ